MVTAQTRRGTGIVHADELHGPVRHPPGQGKVPKPALKLDGGQSIGTVLDWQTLGRPVEPGSRRLVHRFCERGTGAGGTAILRLVGCYASRFRSASYLFCNCPVGTVVTTNATAHRNTKQGRR
jgi:hypothetical protein